jgi:transposase
MARNSRIKKPDEPVQVGRPSKFTPEIRAAIIDAISHRIPYEFAAISNGICEETLYDWINTGNAHMLQGVESDYVQFSKDIKRAEMNKIRTHTDIIAERPERWQADAWILERRWHKHFGANTALNELNDRLKRIEQGGSNHEASPKQKRYEEENGTGSEEG